MYRPLDIGDTGASSSAQLNLEQSNGRRAPVLVFHDDEEQGIPQPVAFQCCPLGAHCYSPRRIDLLQLVDFVVEFPDEDHRTTSRIACTGIVAGCMFDEARGMYRICVKFLDVPEEARNRLVHVSRGAGLLCPYCENF